jgi:hypothetical protein
MWSPFRTAAPPELNGERGRVILTNSAPVPIFCLTAATCPETVRAESDLLQGPIMPGREQAIDVPPGVYRLVAAAGGGNTFHSPLMQASAGGVARWSIAGERGR